MPAYTLLLAMFRYFHQSLEAALELHAESRSAMAFAHDVRMHREYPGLQVSVWVVASDSSKMLTDRATVCLDNRHWLVGRLYLRPFYLRPPPLTQVAGSRCPTRRAYRSLLPEFHISEPCRSDSAYTSSDFRETPLIWLLTAVRNPVSSSQLVDAASYMFLAVL